ANTGNLTVSTAAITTAANGNISLTATGGALTLGAAVTAGGSGTVTATATETTPPTPHRDHLPLNAGIPVQSTGGDVVFRAGDNIVLNATAQVLAPNGNVSFTSGFGDNDNEGAQTLDGTISASTTTGVVTLNLSAQQGATQAGTGSITG